MAISENERKTFDNIVQGLAPGQRFTLIEVFRKDDDSRALVMCFLNERQGKFDAIPFAELIMENPHDLYHTPEGLEEQVLKQSGETSAAKH